MTWELFALSSLALGGYVLFCARRAWIKVRDESNARHQRLMQACREALAEYEKTGKKPPEGTIARECVDTFIEKRETDRKRRVRY